MKNYLKTNFDFESPELIQALDEISLWSAPFGIKLLENIDYKPNISALDIGFGTGFPLIELAFRLGKDSSVYGIDPWKAAIKSVNKKIEYLGLKNITIIEGAAESIPLKDKSIDLITSNNGINNVESIEKVITECARILKTEGQFIQTMNLNKSMFEFYNLLEKVLNEMNLKREIKLMREHIAQKRPSLEYISLQLERNGFEIKGIEHDQFNYRFANGTAMLNHYFIRLAFMESWITLLPPKKLELIFDTIETRLNKASQVDGGLKLSIPFVMIKAIKR